jgi:exopolysaccharide biosynthesis polyprenyl glycosylphosphotransferase
MAEHIEQQERDPSIILLKRSLFWGESILFALVWILYYNQLAFRTHILYGNVACIIIYVILYYLFSRTYHAFKIATYPIAETVFSQFLSFGFSDFLLWIGCNLAYRHYANLLLGIITVALQVLLAIVLVTVSKQYYIHHIIPSPTLIIYGRQGVEYFKQKLMLKYSHLFDFNQVISADESMDKLCQAIQNNQVVFLYQVGEDRRMPLFEYITSQKKQFYITPRVEDVVMQGFSSRNLIDTPIMKFDYIYDDKIKMIIKRICDIIFGCLFFVILSPTFLIAAIAIKAEDHGPVFFYQERCTQNNRIFKIIKFRSMIVDADKSGNVHPAEKGVDPRITKVGRVIRKYRIDEIPQLINVIKGDMSFVGPRPEYKEFVKKYIETTPEFAYRSRVKAGLTGLGQIYGKYNTTPYDKVLWDLEYIENQSFLLDMKIVLLTIKILFMKESTEGVAEGQTTASAGNGLNTGVAEDRDTEK